MSDLKPGSTLQNGKYKIVKTLGKGSFGITYLATTKVALSGGLGKMDVTVNVAIKEFFMSDFNSRSVDGTGVEKTDSSLVKNYLNKFRKEAENLSKLHHPNIVKVLEVFEENNTAYYAMEFIEGETLDDYIKRKEHLPVDESIGITQEVCSALAYMHRHKMLHLDLKPKNIMRQTDGHIRLIDFGLAKQYNENGEPESSTSLGLGTPGYAPIEQAHYRQDGTFPVTLDIYALGATLYKMLTGKTPPESSFVLNEGLPLQPLAEAGISRSVIAVVSRAMAPLKKDRYQSVDAMQQAVIALLSPSGGDGIDEATFFDEESRKKPEPEVRQQEKRSVTVRDAKSSSQNRYWVLLALLIGFAFGAYLFYQRDDDPSHQSLLSEEAVMQERIEPASGIRDSVVVPDPQPQPPVPVARTAEITLKVDSDADIYIDNERMGRRTWRGTLEAGRYLVECRQANRRTTAETLVVEAGRPRTVTLSAPTLLTGKLSVKSDPSGATVLIDGKEQGTTPIVVSNLDAGSHELILRRDGYAETKQTVTVKEDATSETTFSLKSKPAEKNVGKQFEHETKYRL